MDEEATGSLKSTGQEEGIPLGQHRCFWPAGEAERPGSVSISLSASFEQIVGIRHLLP